MPLGCLEAVQLTCQEGAVRELLNRILDALLGKNLSTIVSGAQAHFGFLLDDLLNAQPMSSSERDWALWDP